MKHQNAIIGGQPDVAFDARPQPEGRGKCQEAVLRKTGAIVQAPVCESPWTGV